MTIVKQKLVLLIARKCFPELLQGPLSCRMWGCVEVNQASRSDLKCNKYIKDAETSCHTNKKSQATMLPA